MGGLWKNLPTQEKKEKPERTRHDDGWGEGAFIAEKKRVFCHWAKILMDLRHQSGMSREQLAFESGVGVSTIENYERLKISEPSIYKVELLLKAMGYELDAICVRSSDNSLPQ